MNKLIIYMLFVIFSSCVSEKISVKVSEPENPIIIKLSKKYKKIFKIKIPVGIVLKNNSFVKKSFIKIDYVYNPYSKGVGEEIYITNHSGIIRVKNNKRKDLKSNSLNKYVVYSRYRLDSTKSTQQQFEPYIKKMLAEHKDTLHIGSVQEFKQKHKELFEKLTKNDSISIQFLDGKKLGERITVPVEW